MTLPVESLELEILRLSTSERRSVGNDLLGAVALQMREQRAHLVLRKRRQDMLRPFAAHHAVHSR